MKINKWILINIAISIAMFIYIFYYYSGQSGGDMAIMAINIIFGLFQMLIIALFTTRSMGTKYKIILAVILLQIIELICFIKFGYSINEYLKK